MHLGGTISKPPGENSLFELGREFDKTNSGMKFGKKSDDNYVNNCVHKRKCTDGKAFTSELR